MLSFPTSQPDPGAFKRYHMNEHVALVRKLPRVRAVSYSCDRQAPEGGSPKFCVFAAEFDNGAAMAAAMASPQGQAVAENEVIFPEVPPTLIYYPLEPGI